MELPLIVEHVIFRNDKGFGILATNLDPYSAKYKPEMEELIKDSLSPKYNTLTVSINMLESDSDPKGGQYIFVGEFVNDKKFGKQFKAEFYYRDEPTTEDGLRAFLMEMPNIKEARSDAIIRKFGLEGTIDILNNNIHKLTEINGITEKRIPPIKKEWEDNKHLRDLYGWFSEHKIQIDLAKKAYKKWGKDTLKKLTKNPYCLTELYGIGFHTADIIAHKINKDLPMNFRVTACLRYLLEEALFKNSNLCLPYAPLKETLKKTLLECDENLGKNVDGKKYFDAIPVCLKSNLDIFTIVKDIIEKNIYIYLKKTWEQEYFVVKSLHERKVFNHGNKEIEDDDLAKAEENLSSFTGRKFILDETQKEAIKSAFEHKITIITGAGGTGKSSISRCIFFLAQEKGLSVRMMSPTGKAAQVLTEKTGCGATTIHRGLRFKPGEELPKEEIKEDILLIDEISMCGIDTMYAIMYAIANNKWANIVLVGDKNQLPSVSPGNFLSDIITSGYANVVTLDKIHRQSEKSYISLIANEISKGKVTMIPEDATDIKWHPLDVDHFYEDINGFIDDYLAKGNDIDDLQILSPMKKGICGVYKLNEFLQEKMAGINGTTEDVLHFGSFKKLYRMDRVIQIENNYEKMVFNGDMGVIKELGERAKDPGVSDKKEKFVVVEFKGQGIGEIEYYGDEIDELQTFWAGTVHKYQGSQCKNIVVILAEEANIMASKEILYTAISRGEKRVDIFGHETMLRISPTRSIIRKRYTSFKRISDELKGGQKVLEIMERKEEKHEQGI